MGSGSLRDPGFSKLHPWPAISVTQKHQDCTQLVLPCQCVVCVTKFIFAVWVFALLLIKSVSRVFVTHTKSGLFLANSMGAASSRFNSEPAVVTANVTEQRQLHKKAQVLWVQWTVVTYYEV